MACAVRPAGWVETTQRVGDRRDPRMNEHLIEVCEVLRQEEAWPRLGIGRPCHWARKMEKLETKKDQTINLTELVKNFVPYPKCNEKTLE